MSDDSAVYAIALRLNGLFTRAVDSFVKIPRGLAGAKAQLSPEQFETLLPKLAFGATAVRHYLILAADPRFQGRATPETVQALLAAAPSIGAPSLSVGEVAPVHLGSDVAAPVPPAAEVAPAPSAEGGFRPENQLRSSSSRFEAITGITTAEFALLAGMPPDTFAAVKAAGLGGWLARRRAEEATSLAITIDPTLGFREAAE